MYSIIKFQLKEDPRYHIVIHIEEKIPEQLKVARTIKKHLVNACLTTYKIWTGNMGMDCFSINNDFLIRLANETERNAFNDYDNLFATGLGTMPTNHHMVQLNLKDQYYIGVDVAAEQYRKLKDKKDNVAAEITIASSPERLLQLLRERHKMTEKEEWMLNVNKKDSRILSALKVGRQEEKQEESQTEYKIAQDEAKHVTSVTIVKPSSCRCVIL